MVSSNLSDALAYFDLDFDLENEIGGQNELDFRSKRVGIGLISLFWYETTKKIT